MMVNAKKPTTEVVGFNGIYSLVIFYPLCVFKKSFGFRVHSIIE
jgi:hypothetical protein